MQLDTYERFRHLYLTEFVGVKAYPIIRWRGCRVYPEHWKHDSTEPILRVRMMPWDSSTPAIFGADRLSADDYQKRMSELGWSPDPREGATAWLHVDELEKIKGPIPEGTF